MGTKTTHPALVRHRGILGSIGFFESSTGFSAFAIARRKELTSGYVEQSHGERNAASKTSRVDYPLGQLDTYRPTEILNGQRLCSGQHLNDCGLPQREKLPIPYMFQLIKDARDSWIKNRTAVVVGYYSRRFHMPIRWDVEAKIETPFGTHVSVPLVDGDANRQTCATFSDNNTWNNFVPKKVVGVIVDLGANRGITSLYWKARFPNAELHCIEMDRLNCDSCKSLIEKNGFVGKFWNVAICENDGISHYRNHAANTRHRLDELASQDRSYVYEADKVEVEGLTLRSFLDSRQISHVDIMKVDIEGAEQFLLNTCDQWADRVTNLILEVHHNIDLPWARQTLENAGFEVQIGDESNRMEWWCVRT